MRKKLGNPPYPVTGEILKGYRKAHGWTQEIVAEKYSQELTKQGITRKTHKSLISSIEHGDFKLKYNNLLILLHLLEVDESDFSRIVEELGYEQQTGMSLAEARKISAAAKKDSFESKIDQIHGSMYRDKKLAIGKLRIFRRELGADLPDGIMGRVLNSYEFRIKGYYADTDKAIGNTRKLQLLKEAIRQAECAYEDFEAQEAIQPMGAPSGLKLTVLFALTEAIFEYLDEVYVYTDTLIDECNWEEIERLYLQHKTCLKALTHLLEPNVSGKALGSWRSIYYNLSWVLRDQIRLENCFLYLEFLRRVSDLFRIHAPECWRELSPLKYASLLPLSLYTRKGVYDRLSTKLKELYLSADFQDRVSVNLLQIRDYIKKTEHVTSEKPGDGIDPMVQADLYRYSLETLYYLPSLYGAEGQFSADLFYEPGYISLCHLLVASGGDLLNHFHVSAQYHLLRYLKLEEETAFFEGVGYICAYLETKVAQSQESKTSIFAKRILREPNIWIPLLKGLSLEPKSPEQQASRQAILDVLSDCVQKNQIIIQAR